ncbi:MAG TPA: single-stranded DNA-binding protein [Acholeplasmataceae bacterium]|nr:single-stranded DNA-binding protein [Acholeplasmataceae bacterium]
MAYLNKVMLIGNLGRDPEIRMTATGRKKVSFSLATSKRYRDAAGEQKEITDWHNVVGWGKTADIFEQLNVRKGTSLFVEGSISYRSWDDQNTGQKKYITEINIDVFQLLSKADYTAISQGREYSASTYATPTGEADLNDLPF